MHGAHRPDGAALIGTERDKKKKKLHSCLRKEYFIGLPGALQHLRHQKLYRSSLVQPYLFP
eukprot:4443950-Ditylum_brightwellii.AAC.1